MAGLKTLIGVMGGGAVNASVAGLAYDLGFAIAQAGWVVLCGGRNAGVMAAVAAGAHDAHGLTVGVLPDANTDQIAPEIDIPIVTGMGDARNMINVLSSRVVVALPGGAGTLSEIALALKTGRPLILLQSSYAPLIQQLSPQTPLAVCSDIASTMTQIHAWLS